MRIAISSTRRIVALNTVYQLAGKFFSTVITIIVTVIVTRAYGRDAYGQFTLMQSYPALFFIIVDFGLNAIAVKEIAKDETRTQKVFNSVLVMRLLFSALLVLVLGLILIFFPYSPQLKFGIILSLFLIITQALYATANIVFQAQLKYNFSTLSYVLGSLCILVLVVLFTALGASVVLISFSYVLGGLVVFLINLRLLAKLGVEITFGFDKALAKLLVIQALPLGLMFVFSQVNFKSDTILLSLLHMPSSYGLSNTESVAIYSLPYKVFEVCLVIPTFFMNAVYPLFVKRVLVSKATLLAIFKKSLVILAALGSFAGCVGFFAAPLLIKLLGGSDFTQSVLVLRILFIGLLLFFLSQPVSWLIVTLEKQWFLPIVYCVSAAFNVSANLVLIPRYSFYAASAITVGSELLVLVLLVFYARKAVASYGA